MFVIILKLSITAYFILGLKADITMINVNDGSCEGLEYKDFNGFGVQFTPDSDRDSSTSWIFDRFVDMMGE